MCLSAIRHLHVCKYTHIYVYTHTHIYIKICIYINIYVCIHIFTFIYIYSYMCKHIHIHIWDDAQRACLCVTATNLNEFSQVTPTTWIRKKSNINENTAYCLWSVISQFSTAQECTDRTLAVHERVDSRFLVLPGSESTITETTEYIYFSPSKPCREFKYKSD